jgi:hypothetical protein
MILAAIVLSTGHIGRREDVAESEAQKWSWHSGGVDSLGVGSGPNPQHSGP